jgi:hypothetical protein
MKKILLLFTLMFLSSFAVNAASDGNQKICSGLANWTEDGEFKQVRESKCMTEEEYKAYLSAPDYLCQYYQKSIWKESEREYGKKQYKYTQADLDKIKSLKDEGKALCDAGKLKEGEAKLVEAIKIISHTRMN